MESLSQLGAYLGAGLAGGLGAIGAGLGIGRLAAAAMEASARQPEVLADVRGMAILFAAFVEGVALISTVIGFLLVLTK